MDSAKFLSKLKIDFAKIPSGEITNFPLINFLAKNFQKIILSTGMSNINEIKWAIDVLLKNKIKKKNIILLHCTSSYPAPIKELNLNAIKFLKDKFKLNIGYSDHTTDVLTPIIAISMGAVLIEKHFTLNKNFKGPDHSSSINTREFSQVIKGIDFVHTAMGKFEKKCTSSELKNKRLVRKSIYALKNIKKGELFTERNLISLRPDHGISASKWKNLIGKKSKFNFHKNQKIRIK